jgi:hypothetical protein
MSKPSGFVSVTYEIFQDIRALSNNQQRQLFDMLRSAYPKVLDDIDASQPEPWDYRKNGFGKNEKRLLQFLHKHGFRSERQVFKCLWPTKYLLTPAVEKILRQRLRKMEERIRNKVFVLHSDWILHRPKQRHLALDRSSLWDPA